MSQKFTKISEFSPEEFTIFGYCPECGIYHFLDTDKYAGYSLDDLHCKANCPECGHLGIDCRIIPNT